jgi:hypothetical protein
MKTLSRPELETVIDNIDKKIHTLREKQSKLQEELESKYKINDYEALIGKCYKYLNSYGGSPDCWWEYKKILLMKEENLERDSITMMYTILHISSNNCEIYFKKEFEMVYQYDKKIDHWTEITQDEFFDAYNKIKKELD